jgi:hypothetical protein
MASFTDNSVSPSGLAVDAIDAELAALDKQEAVVQEQLRTVLGNSTNHQM